MLTDGRRLQFRKVENAVRDWGPTREDVVAIALVGSWARSEARMDSDVDIVVLVGTVDPFIGSEEWIVGALGEPGTVTRTADWGALTERRVQLASGLEVEFGFAQPSWADVDPVDPGTQRVVGDGCIPWHDPHEVLALLLDSMSS